MEENNKTNISLREEKILDFWKKNKIFEKSLKKNSTQGEYVFYDGPPFATGTPHYGHIIGSTVKDVIGRYKTMSGYYVSRKWGWDCHGLPIENIAEKGLGISGRDKIEEIGINKFNKYARECVLGFVESWRKTVARIGRWVDFEGSYKTMDNSYIESVWWALKEMDKKGLLYEGERVLPYCPRCETPISNSEIAMDNSYRDIKDISAIVKFKLLNQINTFILAWTTTPWTLPGNVALAINSKIIYVKVKVDEDKDDYYICAKELVERVFSGKQLRIISEFTGNKLIGEAYAPPFDYFIKDKAINNCQNGWKIYEANFVNIIDGTGVVHIAPAFGEDDMSLAKSKDLPIIKHVNGSGQFTDKVKDFALIKVKPKDDHQSGDILIIKYLAKTNQLFSKLKIDHEYPHCYRCGTPLYYYAIPAWFLNIQKVKNRILTLNEKINWVPSHLKYGRFKYVLENAPDWNISRNRYWASPLPIWKCKCGKFKVIGSVSELRRLADQKLPDINKIDLHRPYIDQFTVRCDSCGETMYRVPEVFDCWFESGAMPFASQHYPFSDNSKKFNPEKRIGFPGDFIAEYIPQTRTWFYYMLATSTILFDETPYLNVVTTGNVLASDGRKMSKSLKNYPDPQSIFDTCGVDALRLYLLSSPLMKGEDIKFSDKEVADIAKKTLGRLVNVYEFYKLYRNNNNIYSDKSDYPLDRWIIARTKQLHSEITLSMEAYEIDKAVKNIGEFVDDLSTWYIRRNRIRMKSGNLIALETIHWVLREFSKMIAPFAPFHAEWLWGLLRESDDENSVHLTAWSNVSNFDVKIIKEMHEIRKLISSALEMRAHDGIPVRQPVSSVTFRHARFSFSVKEIIADELNVKNVFFDPMLDSEVAIDTRMTEELIEEGKLRVIVRALQDARKKAGLRVGELVDMRVSVSDKEKTIIQKYEKQITKQASVSRFIFQSGDFSVEPINYDRKKIK